MQWMHGYLIYWGCMQHRPRASFHYVVLSNKDLTCVATLAMCIA